MHIGLIGAGNISETHARAASEIAGTSISAIYGSNPAKTSRLAKEYGAQAYSDYQAFLMHRPMEIVIIGSPSGLHASQGVSAAQHGLHVLTEKPLDISTAHAGELIAAADQAGVKLGVLYQDRTKPDIRTLKKWIEEGLLGKLLLVNAQLKWYRPPEYYAESKWRGTTKLDGGGALINQGSHTIDLLLWLCGEVSRVQAHVATVLHSVETEDVAVAALEFACGAVGTLFATTAAFPGYPRRVEITGTNGTVILEHDRIVAADLRKPPTDALASAGGDTNNSASSAVVSDVSGHRALIEDFVAAIREDRRPLCDGRDGLRSLELIERIYRAAKQAS